MKYFQSLTEGYQLLLWFTYDLIQGYIYITFSLSASAILTINYPLRACDTVIVSINYHESKIIQNGEPKPILF